MSFYLFLPSNVCQGYFPQNRISAFQVKLPKRIQFNPNEYEVALTEFTYVHCMKTYIAEIQRCIWYFKEAINGISDLQGRNVLPNINYSNPQTLVAEINKQLKRGFGDIGDITINSKSNKVQLNVLRGQVNLSNSMGVNLGFADTYMNKVTLHFEFKKGTHIADKTPVLHGGMYHIFVYSDIVKSQIVGDSLVPLLRIVNITGVNDEVVTQTFRPYYLPINKLEFDTVEVLLCNEFGEEIHFEKGQSIVTLHFKKINNGNRN